MRLDNKRASRIAINYDFENLNNEEERDAAAGFLKNAMLKLIAATKKHSAVVNK
jgi:hypothetical protein